MKVGIRITQKEKCFGQELVNGELAAVEFASPKPHSVVIKGPNQKEIFTGVKKTTVRYAFSAVQSGHHVFCIKSDAGQQIVDLMLNVGPDAKDYSQIATKQHIDPIEVALKKIEEKLRVYHKNVLYLRSREERMRKTNNSTAFRVIGFCLFSVILMIVMGGWQMLYFKNFFKAKKII